MDRKHTKETDIAVDEWCEFSGNKMLLLKSTTKV
jgi:hypothetical protein